MMLYAACAVGSCLCVCLWFNVCVVCCVFCVVVWLVFVFLQLGFVCVFECELVERSMCALSVNNRVALHGLILCFVCFVFLFFFC